MTTRRHTIACQEAKGPLRCICSIDEYANARKAKRMTIKEMQAEAGRLAREKGWYDGVVIDNNWIMSRLMLKVTELAEACEEVRRPGFVPTDVYFASGDMTNKPEGFGIELADCVIRVMDTCDALGVDLEEMIRIKHAYNKTRPYKHGKTA